MNTGRGSFNLFEVSGEAQTSKRFSETILLYGEYAENRQILTRETAQDVIFRLGYEDAIDLLLRHHAGLP